MAILWLQAVPSTGMLKNLLGDEGKFAFAHTKDVTVLALNACEFHFTTAKAHYFSCEEESYSVRDYSASVACSGGG